MNDPTQQPATLRLFIALAPPDRAKEELARAMHPARHPEVRWNRIEDWHLTLAFLGELPAATVPPLRAALAELAAHSRALRLSLRGSGTFDDRVAWSGVDGEVAGLHELADAVRSVVAACGIPYEGRPLRPHLTLARSRRGDRTSMGEIAEGLADFEGAPWYTERLHLVGSNAGRSPGPIRYRDIESWPLARPGVAEGPAGEG